jgi:RNA polymerase sigma-70 factor (ECF subfamily)
LATNEPVPNHRVGANGRVAFATVVNEHWTAVYRLLHCLTGHLQDTEDLTQETFLRALRQYDSFQPNGRLRAWLLRIATNAFYDVQRRRKRSRLTRLDEEPVYEAPPGQAVEMAEQGQLVREAMKELPETTRLVFHLRVQEDLSYREIAEMTGTSEQAARWHMHEARTRLLNLLAGKL